ncbi:unnamed protein product [Cochlearia groenlandica]
MWLKKSDETKNQNEIQDGGIITFGGYDSAYFYGEHKYVPLVDDQRYWEFTMNQIFLGPQGSGFCMGIGGCRVFIDSGFPVIGGPEDLIESLNIALGGDEVGTVRKFLHCPNHDRCSRMVRGSKRPKSETSEVLYDNFMSTSPGRFHLLPHGRILVSKILLLGARVDLQQEK